MRQGISRVKIPSVIIKRVLLSVKIRFLVLSGVNVIAHADDSGEIGFFYLRLSCVSVFSAWCLEKPMRSSNLT